MSNPGDPSTLFLAVTQYSRDRSEANKRLILETVSSRLERLTRGMMSGQSVVKRWDETADIAQMAMLKLWRALDEIDVQDSRALIAVAAQHIRWILIDRARKHRGPQGYGANHASEVREKDDVANRPSPKFDAVDGGDRSLKFIELHEAVERLPEDLRTIVDLIYYHGMTQAEAAIQVEASEKTVQRRLARAQLRLAEQLGGQPGDWM